MSGSDTINAAPPGCVVVTQRGLQGVLIEKGPGWRAACDRHDRLLDALDRTPPKEPGAEVIVRLIADAPILSVEDLAAATSSRALLYECAGKKQLEWQRGDDGWRDRRWLGTALAHVIERNGGVQVQLSDWSAAVRFLRRPGSDDLGSKPWPKVIADAQAWWLDRLPRLLFGHVANVQRLQPLPREAWARWST